MQSMASTAARDQSVSRLIETLIVPGEIQAGSMSPSDGRSFEPAVTTTDAPSIAARALGAGRTSRRSRADISSA